MSDLNTMLQQLPPGLRQLVECFREIVRAELDEREARRAEVLDPLSVLTAEGLCDRWGICGETRELRLHALAARCRRYGLRPLPGTRGDTRRFALADVITAENRALGRVRA